MILQYFTFSRLCILLGCCFFVFFSFSSLTEIPPTWMDEGAINQVAMNLANSGTYGYQIAPGNFVSAEFLTTGYPVVYPVAVSFMLLGTNLFAARLVMVFFMFLVVVSAYWYVVLLLPDKSFRPFFPVLSFFLLISFAPLYGHGKNVLGEVPGFSFLLLSLLSLLIVERKNRSWWILLLSGVFSGLAAATKPLYLVTILPASLFVLLILRRNYFSLKEKGLFVLGIIVPLIWWIIVQSGDGSLLHIFSYGNPNQSSFVSLITGNALRFFTEFQPVYFLGLLFFWWVGVLLWKHKGITVGTAELFALSFSFLNLLSFLTTRGFYRYFFASQVLALLFFPFAVYYCSRLRLSHAHSLWSTTLLVAILIGVQSYQFLFHSWVSDSYGSHRTAELSQELEAIPPERSLFFYHVPEAVLFFPHRNYYQYLQFADTVKRGEEFLPLLQKGVPDFLLVDVRFSTSSSLLDHYQEKTHFDKYTLYEKK